MPMIIRGKSYYLLSEASQLSGVSKRTVYRWMHQGIISGRQLRNRNGWRLFTIEDIAKIQSEAERVRKESGSGKYR